jgi:hypothetical protein
MIQFENDRIAYHIERQFRRGRSKFGMWGYLSDKSFLPEIQYYLYDLSKYYQKEEDIKNKIETIFKLIQEENIGKVICNKGKNKSPKFWFNKLNDRSNKFTTI